MAGYSEGQSTNRPPLFDGTDYSFWKHRMRIFIRSQDLDVWHVVEHGNFIPQKRVDGKLVPKEYEELTADDKKHISMNDKALSILICGITREVFNSVSHCETAQDMWKLLEVTHEGTSKVKKAKMNILTSEFEKFRLKDKETLSEMYTRFSQLINKMRALGKKFDVEDLNNKLLNVVQWKYRAEVASIKEAKDLEVTTLEEIVGSLMTYEMEATHQEDDRRERRSLALKADTEAGYISSESVRSSDGSDDDQELAMLARRIKTLINRKKNKGRYSNTSYSKSKSQRSKASTTATDEASTSKRKEVTCFRCGQKGHMRHDCRVKLPKEESKLFGRGKNRVMMTFDYSDDEVDGLHDDEAANIVHEPEDLCLVAKDNLSEVNYESADLNDDNVSTDSDSNVNSEMLHYIDALETKCKLLGKKNRKLKEELKTISEQQSICSECAILKQDLDQARHELDQLKTVSCSQCENYEKRLSELGNLNLALELKVDEMGKSKSNLDDQSSKKTKSKPKKTRKTKSKNKKVEKTNHQLRGSKAEKPSSSQSKDCQNSTTPTYQKSNQAWMYGKSSMPRLDRYQTTPYNRHDYWYRSNRPTPDQVYARPRPWCCTFVDVPYGYQPHNPYTYNPYRFHSWDYDSYPYDGEPRRCYYCNKLGHLVADCRFRLCAEAAKEVKGNNNKSGPTKWVPKFNSCRSQDSMEVIEVTMKD